MKEADLPFRWTEGHGAYWYQRGRSPKLVVGTELDRFAMYEDKRRLLLDQYGFRYEIDAITGISKLSPIDLSETDADNPNGIPCYGWGVAEEGLLNEEEIRSHKDWFMGAIEEFNLACNSRSNMLDSYIKMFTNNVKSYPTVHLRSRLEMITELAEFRLKP